MNLELKEWLRTNFKIYLDKIEVEINKLRSNSTEFIEGTTDKLVTVKQLKDDSDKIYPQSTLSDTWVINHNSNRKRDVQVYTEGGVKMLGDIQIIDKDTTIVYFLKPVKGFSKVI